MRSRSKEKEKFHWNEKNRINWKKKNTFLWCRWLIAYCPLICSNECLWLNNFSFSFSLFYFSRSFIHSFMCAWHIYWYIERMNVCMLVSFRIVAPKRWSMTIQNTIYSIVWLKYGQNEVVKDNSNAESI